MSETYYQTLATQDAQAAGVPVNLFLQQIQDESGFNPDPSGGVTDGGIAQIQPATASDPGYGLSSVNPLDPSAALAFAANYDAALYAANGNSWVNALQAYGTTSTAAGTSPNASQQALITMAQAADSSTNGTLPGTFVGDYTGGQTISDAQGAVAAQPAANATENPLGTLASFLGLNISFYDIGLIVIGVILVLGALFFISKPAVQTVTVNAAKAAKAVGSIAA